MEVNHYISNPPICMKIHVHKKRMRSIESDIFFKYPIRRNQHKLRWKHIYHNKKSHVTFPQQIMWFPRQKSQDNMAVFIAFRQ